jgi:hypothetical protein
MCPFFIQDCTSDEYMLLPVGRIHTVQNKGDGILAFDIFRIEKKTMTIKFSFQQFKARLCESTDLTHYWKVQTAEDLVDVLKRDLKECFPTRDE